MMKKILLPLALVILVGGAIGMYMYNKPRANFKSAKADFSLTADELFDSYTSNEEEGDATYLEKIIQVEGKLEEIVESENGKISLMLTAANAPVGGVNAQLDERFSNAEGLEVGQTVTIKGMCTGLQDEILTDVVLNSCLVVN